MPKAQLKVFSPELAQHAGDIIDLTAKTFGGFYSFGKHLREWYLLNSQYDWNASAVGYLDGQMVTHFGVWRYDMRIGRSTVRCGGVGAVATHGDYRKRGLMSQTTPHSLDAMRKLGYDLTVLFGARDFYHRFGYVRAWNDTNWYLSCDEIPAAMPAVKYEKFTAVPSEEIADLHNRHNASVTGSAVRPTFTKSYKIFHGKIEGYLWKSGGMIAGHVLLEANSRLVCLEATGEPDQVLAVLGSLAKKKQLKEIFFDTLAYKSPLARRLRQLTCRTDEQYIKSGGPMVCLLNLQSCLEKICPELSRRLKTSELSSYSGSLKITSLEGSATLAINKGKVTLGGQRPSKSAITGGHEIAQLLMGTDSPMEICEAGKMKLTGEAARLLPVLFPNEHPQLHQVDRY